MRIYLADLGHNFITVTSDVYPLGVANLAAYANKHVKSDEPIEFEIFREPEELEAAINKAAPDILGVSSYSWNHHLALRMVRYAKEKNADILTIMGGPNFPLTVEEQESWMRTMPEIDIHTRGPTYEGEVAFTNLVQRFVDVDANVDQMFSEPLQKRAHVEDRLKSLIQSRLETFGEHPQGMGRFTRTMFAKDLRRKIEVKTTIN